MMKEQSKGKGKRKQDPTLAHAAGPWSLSLAAESTQACLRGKAAPSTPPKLQDVSGLSSRPHCALQPGVTGGFGEARSQGH